jgi:hypothetical protein
VNLLLTGVDFAALIPVGSGAKGTVFDAISNPRVYTNADCPRYNGAAGPNCGSGTSGQTADKRVLTTGSNYGGNSSSVGSPKEVRTVKAAASSITGIPAALIPDAADLLLGPLLRGTPTVIR